MPIGTKYYANDDTEFLKFYVKYLWQDNNNCAADVNNI